MEKRENGEYKFVESIHNHDRIRKKCRSKNILWH